MYVMLLTYHHARSAFTTGTVRKRHKKHTTNIIYMCSRVLIKNIYNKYFNYKITIYHSNIR